MEAHKIRVAIIDYGLGNLFSVKHACEHVGIEGFVTSDKAAILAADAVILPGVGAFGDAMENLRKLDLVHPLQDIAEEGKPLIGVCLGLQLFMTESSEFGAHRGLGFIAGPVSRFDNPMNASRKLKIPQIGWNCICRVPHSTSGQMAKDSWVNTPLEGLPDGEFMYFVHSYHAQPEDSEVILSTSRYGHIEFCSSLQHRNIFACQFHPERSGPQGLQIYRNMIAFIQEQHAIKEHQNA